jgi:hypothetical protein
MITSDHQVRFKDGGTFWTPGFSRAMLLIQEARDQLFAKSYESELLSTKKRFAVYFALAGVYLLIMAILGNSLPPDPERPRLPFYALVAMFGAMSAGSMLVPTSWLRLDSGPNLKYFKHSRKQRRAEHRKAISRMLNRKFLVDLT